MLFYVFIFAFVFLSAVLEEHSARKWKKCIVILMLFILACASGLRYNGGKDIELYQHGYEAVPFLFSSDFIDFIGSADSFFWEPGYLVYISFLKWIVGLSFYGYLLIDAIIFYILLYVGYKKYTIHWGILLMFFLYKMFFYETFVAMRQQMSICLFFIIMHLVEDRKPFKYYLLLSLIVFPFHYGGVILFLVYFLNYLKITKKRFFTLGVILLPFAFLPQIFSQVLEPLMSSAFGDKGMGYFSGDETQSIFYTLETYLVWFLIYANYNGIVRKHPHGEFMIKLFLIILPCVTLFRDVVILRREMDYFYLSIPVLLGYIYDIKIKLRPALFIGLAIVCFYGYIRYINNFDGGKSLLPYVSWLELPNATFFLR